MEIGSITDTGKRRDHNEDAFYISKDQDLFIVADGVGGHNAGEIASGMAVSDIAAYLDENMAECENEPRHIFGCIADSLDLVNQSIYEKSNSDKSCFKMATTVVVMYVRQQTAYFANIGDSRAYLLREGRLLQITEDHTLVNQYIKEGKMKKEDVKQDPNQSVMARWAHTITRALGDSQQVEADFYMVEMKENDCFLLCSDGLYGELEDERIAGILREKSQEDAQKACEALVEEANRNGGGDNITVILVRNGE